MFDTFASPILPQVAACRRGIKELLTQLERVGPEFDRVQVHLRLRQCIGALYSVLDSTALEPVHLQGLISARKRLTEAQAFAPPAAGLSPEAAAVFQGIASFKQELEGCEDTIAAKQMAELRTMPSAGGPSGALRGSAFQVSRGFASLYRMERKAIEPPEAQWREAQTVSPDANPPSAPPEDMDALRKAMSEEMDLGFEEDDDEGDGEAEAIALTPSNQRRAREAAMARELGRGYLEALAGLYTLRMPIDTETWANQAPFEGRLLAQLDAWMALGMQEPEELLGFYSEGEHEDPARAFCAALVLGSTHGTDASSLALELLEKSTDDERFGFEAGLCLAPGGQLDMGLYELLPHSSPSLAAALIRILKFRRTLTFARLGPALGRQEPEVVAALIEALGWTCPDPQATAYLQGLAMNNARANVAAQAWRSLLFRGHPEARRMLRSFWGGDSAWAARSLAYGGSGADGPSFLKALAAGPDAGLVSALGRLGWVGAVEPLLELLSNDEEEVAKAAAEALYRITAAPLLEQRQEPWPLELDTPLPPDAPPIPMRTVTAIITDRARWQDYWKRQKRAFDPELKWRLGSPFHLSQPLQELNSAQVPVPERTQAYLELRAGLPSQPRLEQRDWVARQRRHLVDIQGQVQGVRIAPGAFAFAGAASR